MTILSKAASAEVLHELQHGTPNTPERLAMMREADELYARISAERLARALCDSSSHINLLPHDEQRPGDYHRKRAKDTLALLGRKGLLP